MKKDRQPSGAISFFSNFEAKLKIVGLGGTAFLLMTLLLFVVLWMDILPDNMGGALFTLVIFGGALYYLGSHLPIFKSYLGGGSVFATVGAAIIAGLGLVPSSAIGTVRNFISTSNFLEFYIVSLIISAILKMDRQLLLKSAVRFLPVAFLAMVANFFVVGLVGQLLGLGFVHTSLYISFPVMAGGVGAGIVPLSTIYGSALGLPAGPILSQLFPALVLSNLLAIIGAGLLVKNTEQSTWNGHGDLLKATGEMQDTKTATVKIEFERLLVGMMVAMAFYLIGLMLHHLLPSINAFAFLILVAIAAKASNLVPTYYERSAVLFGQLIVQTMTKALLAGVGLALLDLSALLETVTWQLAICVIVSVVTIALVAGYLGKIFGLYPVESAVTAGLVNNSMGGTGNVAVLSAANRMNLIAFAQMGNRIGGAIVLVIAGFFVTVFA